MKAKTKQWGNLLVLIIPSDKIKKMKLRPGEEVNINIEKRSNVLKELFGAFKFNKSTEQRLKEERNLVSKWE